VQSHLDLFTGTITKITNFYTEHNCGDSLKFSEHTQIQPPTVTKRRALSTNQTSKTEGLLFLQLPKLATDNHNEMTHLTIQNKLVLYTQLTEFLTSLQNIQNSL